MTLGRKLSKARTNAGLSQSFVANVFSITRQAVSNWESNKTEPNLRTLRALARLYDVDFFWLVSEDDGPSFDDEVIHAAARARAFAALDEKTEEWEREFRSLIRRMKRDFAEGVPSESTTILKQIENEQPEVGDEAREKEET